jgi:Tfp pilus assembly protein PilO
MWSRSITKAAQLSAWFRTNDKRLRGWALSLLAVVVLNLLLYSLLVAPALAKRADGEARIAELRRRHAAAVLFEKQKESVAGLLSGVPAQKDMPLLIKDLVQTARSLNLSVASVKYDIPAKSSSDLAQLAFLFPVEGRYPDIKRFIYDVETTGRLVGIQAVKLDSEKGKVKMEMKLLTYIKGQ